MKEQEFNKVISELVLALEAAGVYDAQLKISIDRLFDLKDTLTIKDAVKSNSTCLTCSYYKEGACMFLSATISEGIKIEFLPANKERLKVMVPITFRCKFYKP